VRHSGVLGSVALPKSETCISSSGTDALGLF